MQLDHKKILAGFLFLAALLLGFFLYGLGTPTHSNDFRPVSFVVSRGDGFFEIANNLKAEGIIRSAAAFELLGFLTGRAVHIKPGNYSIVAPLGASDALRMLIEGSRHEVSAVIPEGFSMYDIDRTLSDQGIIVPGSLVAASRLREAKGESSLEGRLFPDTYHFFTDSDTDEVIQKFLDNFEIHLAPLVGSDPRAMHRVLTLASLVQNEVPDFEDQKIVAGILEERLRIGMPLQVDATICYIKEFLSSESLSCYPLRDLDFKIDSPYNTYLYKGLPPNPIGNPGLFAVRALLEAKRSPYLYYLSDPATRKTIFSKTLEEHGANRLRYLKDG